MCMKICKKTKIRKLKMIKNYPFALFLFIEAALNLFINSNAQELLKEMKPALRTKLTLVIRNFMDRIFAKIPLDQWINLN